MLFKQITKVFLSVLNSFLKSGADEFDKENLRRQERGQPPIVHW